MHPAPDPTSTVFKPHPRWKFNQSEDALLAKAVADLGGSDWARIAERIPGRSVRQCKERWANYISPAVGNGPWTPEEEQLLVRKYSEIGPKWKRIASFFGARTDINVRSRWNLIQRRIKREAKNRTHAPLSHTKHRDAYAEVQPRPPPLEDTWDRFTMNDECPSEEAFDIWTATSPY
jgi:hypothetical protein